jgi:hypothetical protein
MRHSDHMREHAQRVREDAHRETDPLTKARLHQIADDLDKAAEEIERDHERRS